MTKEEIVQAIADDKIMPFIQPEQLASIVDFVIKNHEPSLPSNLDEAAIDIVNDAIDSNDTTIVKYDGLLRYLVKAGAEWMQNKMFSLRFENEPLDSAARNVFKEWIPMEVLTIDGIDGGIPLYNQGALIMMFDAGAKWMARQGATKEAVIGMATEEISINVSQQTLDKLDLCTGDKVVVQIRKK